MRWRNKLLFPKKANPKNKNIIYLLTKFNVYGILLCVGFTDAIVVR